MVKHIIKDAKSGCTGLTYSQDDKDKVVDKVREQFPPIVKMLGDKSFLMGEKECYMDFFWLSLVKQMTFYHPSLFLEFPTLKPYVERMHSLPGLKEYIDDPKHREANMLIGAPGPCKITDAKGKYVNWESKSINSVGVQA
jgi:glutathione S-transferase